MHEKGLQRQKGFGPLVSSQEQRVLLVPRINCLSTAGQPLISLVHLFTLDFVCSCFWKDAQATFRRSLGRYKGLVFSGRTVLLAPDPARPRPAAPPGAPTRPAHGVSGFWIRQVNSIHAQHVRQEIRLSSQQPLLVNLSSPKPGHTTGGSRRGARRGGRAGSGRTVCQQDCSPREESFLAFSKASKTRRLNVSPEARTSEIVCKPMEEQNPQLTTGSSAVYHWFISGTRSALCSWLPTSGTTPFCLCQPFSCKACPGIFKTRSLHYIAKPSFPGTPSSTCLWSVLFFASMNTRTFPLTLHPGTT